MKTKMLILLVASAATLSGCMVYPRHSYSDSRGGYDNGGGNQNSSSHDAGSRRGHRDRDRDGDGTRNRYDRAPNNPRIR